MQYVDWQKLWKTRKKLAIINSFAYSYFNYCRLFSHSCSCDSSQKIKKMLKPCLKLVRTLLDDYESGYGNLRDYELWQLKILKP